MFHNVISSSFCCLFFKFGTCCKYHFPKIWNTVWLDLSLKQTPGRYPKSCYEAKSWNRTNSSHVIIRPELAPEPFVVLCDMDIDEGGWTYILNRYDGSQNFSKNWDSYKAGFGHIAGEFWLGLEKIYQLVGKIPTISIQFPFFYIRLTYTKNCRRSKVTSSALSRLQLKWI